MKLSKERLRDLSDGLGYRAEILEKVLHLLELLQAITDDPWLYPRLPLKGGTALNLFVLDLPRLSVDIDINYIGAVDKGTMEAERPLCGISEALKIHPSPSDESRVGDPQRPSKKS